MLICRYFDCPLHHDSEGKTLCLSIQEFSFSISMKLGIHDCLISNTAISGQAQMLFYFDLNCRHFLSLDNVLDFQPKNECCSAFASSIREILK